MATIVGSLDGDDVHEVVLTSKTGVSVAILTYGALIRDWRVPVGNTLRPVVLGFDKFDPYPTHSPYFGAIAGRVANRIGGAKFALNGTTYTLPANEGPNHLHGGPGGTGKKIWRIAEEKSDSVKLTLTSPHGDMGYPGTLTISVTYSLVGNRLDIDFAAETDTPTPVNIVQHNYFNLAGSGDILDHTLTLRGGAYTELGEGQIPTGAILPVTGTDLDFRIPRTLRDAQGQGQKIDFNFVLDAGRDPQEPAAIVEAPDGALTLRLYTDQPGLQVYNAWKLDVKVPGLDGASYAPFAGLCLEDQNFPDAVNHPHFPSPVVTPAKPYRHWCAIEIG